MLRRTRHQREVEEQQNLSPKATQAAFSQGRDVSEEPDEFRTAFERDRDRIIHSKAFRRLKHKTQVFMLPEGDHYLTRLTHTVQVTQIGRSLARALGLNEDLTEAICLAHDVGHSPFGHTGEEALSQFRYPDEWRHSDQGVRQLSILEPLNLSWEVLDGIRAHSWKVHPPPATPEGWLCRYADRIAYLAHDAADAIRSGILSWDEFPAPVLERLGQTGREWIHQLISAVIEYTFTDGEVGMDTETLAVMTDLREFLFERVYLRESARLEREQAKQIVSYLVDFYHTNPEEVPDNFRVDRTDDLSRAIDYVAGMTDRFALGIYQSSFPEQEDSLSSLLALSS